MQHPISARRLKSQRGAVTITFLYPYTTAPTAAQQAAVPHSTVVATVSASAAADTSAVITHNFNLSAAEITQGFPTVILAPQDGNEITSAWFELSENPNYTVLGKGTVAAGGTQKVTIMRPATNIR